MISNPPSPKTDYFHPLTLGVCGAPGSGKSTLIQRLLERWQSRFQLGYLSSTADSCPAPEGHGLAGTRAHWNRPTGSWAHWAPTASDLLLQRQLFQNCDWLLVEGWEQAPWPKLVFLDAQGEVLERVRRGEIREILAFISASTVPAELPAPCLERNDLAALQTLIETWLDRQMAAIPLYGLVLAGGQSQRMGRDKAQLRYGSKTQLECSLELLQPLCNSVWISCRPGQSWNIDGLYCLPDQFQDCGPLGGILTALEKVPQAAWLVVAVDLPLLDSQTLQTLVQGRNPLCQATCFQSSHDGLPEPLCAIYEPRIRERLFSFLGAGYRCPRKALINSRIELLSLPHPHSLDNANTPADFERIRALLQDTQI